MLRVVAKREEPEGLEPFGTQPEFEQFLQKKNDYAAWDMRITFLFSEWNELFRLTVVIYYNGSRFVLHAVTISKIF